MENPIVRNDLGVPLYRWMVDLSWKNPMENPIISFEMVDAGSPSWRNGSLQVVAQEKGDRWWWSSFGDRFLAATWWSYRSLVGWGQRIVSLLDLLDGSKDDTSGSPDEQLEHPWFGSPSWWPVGFFVSYRAPVDPPVDLDRPWWLLAMWILLGFSWLAVGPPLWKIWLRQLGW